MRWSKVLLTAFFGTGLVVYLGSTAACGGASSGSGFGGSSGGGSGSGGSGGSSGAGSSSGNSGGSSGGCGITGCGSSSGGSSGSSSGGGVACPTGLQCNVSCSGGGTTTISGVVYDPAGADPLYDIAVYVPAVPLVPLPKGVAADACNCASLYKSGAVVATTTGVDGSFKLDNAPVGQNVPLVMQIGKWRKQVMINVTACTNNAQPAGMLKLPGSVAAGDTNDNMPDIAVSTGGADTLECLMSRIGLPSSEYSAGAGGAGHVHVFSGGSPGGGGGGGGGVGRPESGWQGAGAPESDTTLWNSQTSLMPYDILLLSCEGGETYNANPAVLESYLNAGGRAFGSHFHYAWFAGPLQSGQGYSAPSDWGTNLASWAPGSGSGIGLFGDIVQTLNGSTQPFAKGVALYQWLGLNGALQAMKLPVTQPKFNAIVGPGNKPSQPWINYDQNAAGNTAYFSFDTPVNAPVPADGGAPAYCGRAVFSDLHVSGTDPAPSCNPGPLSPQEKALEFMLFDLSSCVIPDNVPPTADGGVPPVFQ